MPNNEPGASQGPNNSDPSPTPDATTPVKPPSSLGEAVVDQSVFNAPSPIAPPAPSLAPSANLELSASAPAPAPSPAAPGEYNHGYYTPSQQEMTKFDQAVAAGADLNQMDPRFRASIYVAKGADALSNFDVFRTLVWDPAKDSANKNLSAGVQEATSNPLGFAVSKASDALNWLAARLEAL